MRLRHEAKAALLGDWGEAEWPTDVLKALYGVETRCEAANLAIATAPKHPPTVVLLYMDLQVMDKGRDALLERIKKVETA